MLELCTPAIEDLWFRETMCSDEETMSFNHATAELSLFPKNDGKTGTIDGLSTTKASVFTDMLPITASSSARSPIVLMKKNNAI